MSQSKVIGRDPQLSLPGYAASVASRRYTLFTSGEHKVTAGTPTEYIATVRTEVSALFLSFLFLFYKGKLNDCPYCTGSAIARVEPVLDCHA